MRRKVFLKSVFVLCCSTIFGYAQTPTPAPRVVGEVTVNAIKANTDSGYVAFRNLSENPNAFGGEYATVSNLKLKRDAATFVLRSGEIYFLTSDS